MQDKNPIPIFVNFTWSLIFASVYDCVMTFCAAVEFKVITGRNFVTDLGNGLPVTTKNVFHYTDVIMIMMASQITSLTVVYSTVYSDADQRKHQSSASLAFVWGIHRDR